MKDVSREPDSLLLPQFLWDRGLCRNARREPALTKPKGSAKRSAALYVKRHGHVSRARLPALSRSDQTRGSIPAMRSRTLIFAVPVLLALFALAQQPPQQPAPPPSPPPASPAWTNTAPRASPSSPTISDNSPATATPTPPSSRPRPARTASSFSETPSLISGISKNIFLASPTSTAASEGRPLRKCWSAFART
jgi:hypothetical protein